MKKIFSLVLTALMFVIVFSSCQKDNRTGNIINQGVQSDVEISNVSPPDSTTYSYNTYNRYS